MSAGTHTIKVEFYDSGDGEAAAKIVVDVQLRYKRAALLVT